SLAAAKLVWAGNTEQRTSDAEKADKVIAQTPAPYEKVLPGTPIEFTVARLDPRIYLAQIELTIQSDVDQVVSVALVRQDGTEEMQYCALHAAGSQCVVSLVLCSEVAGEQSYRVYYQDRSVTENKVTFQ
ncbi:MAG: PASTA domain-containing protein, partial [Clostridia bacterium]